MESGWTGGLIQFKSLHRTKNGSFRWHLNRTKSKKQHSLLCLTLSRQVVLFFYCFPMFEDYPSSKLLVSNALMVESLTGFRLRPSKCQHQSMSNTTLSFNPSRPRGHVHSEEATEIPMGANVPFEVALEALLTTLR